MREDEYTLDNRSDVKEQSGILYLSEKPGDDAS